MIKTQGGIRKSGVLSPWRNPYDPTDRFYRPVSAITRAILNFNGTQYGESAETYSILPGDDFEVDVIVASPGEGAAYDVAAWISMTENTESGKALHVGRRDGDKVTMSFWGDDLNVDLTGQIDWSQINRFTFSYDGTTRTQTIKLNGVDVGSNARVSDVNISTAKILINKFRTVVGSGSYFSITAAINGESIVNYRFDEPDTSYQRNYASAITDPNDPDWSGAILQNVLPGDWETISQASGQTNLLGTTELRRSDEDIKTNTPSTYDASLGVIHLARNADGTGGVDFSENLTSGHTYRFYAKYKDYFGPVSGITQINLGLYRALTTTNLIPVQPFPAVTEYEEISYIGTAASDSSLSAICGGSSRGISLKDFSVRRILQYAEGAL